MKNSLIKDWSLW